MRKLFSLLLVLVVAGALCSVAFAAVKVGTFGAPSSGTYPLEVDSDGTITVNDDLVVASGDVTITADIAATGTLTVTGDLDVDESVYASEFTLDSSYTVDPCGTLNEYSIFVASGGNAELCFCNSMGVDLSLYDGSTACF